MNVVRLGSTAQWLVGAHRMHRNRASLDITTTATRTHRRATICCAHAQTGSGDERARLERMEQVMSEVYGPWHADVAWRPKPFSPGHSHMGRYLWTDAFGVMNFLTLYRATRDQRYLMQARALVSEVHDTLGRTRDGGARLAGATDDHPTRGGLRIGKTHPEGHHDGDGQYYHYLTKWMLALTSIGLAAREPQYIRWAVELAEGVHDAFLNGGQSVTRGASRYGVPGGKSLAWKMSIDLSHVAVQSSGNLDPYDGLVTYTLIQAAVQRLGITMHPGNHVGVDESAGEGSGAQLLVLQRHINDMREMVQARYASFDSGDPLDLGESLWLAHWQLTGTTTRGVGSWADTVSSMALQSLNECWEMGEFSEPLTRRLAFREFGTSLGLQAILSAAPTLPDAAIWKERVNDLHAAWESRLYTRDHDITPVMYCSSLVPGVWLSHNWHNMLEEAAAAVPAGRQVSTDKAAGLAAEPAGPTDEL